MDCVGSPHPLWPCLRRSKLHRKRNRWSSVESPELLVDPVRRFAKRRDLSRVRTTRTVGEAANLFGAQDLEGDYRGAIRWHE